MALDVTVIADQDSWQNRGSYSVLPGLKSTVSTNAYEQDAVLIVNGTVAQATYQLGQASLNMNDEDDCALFQALSISINVRYLDESDVGGDTTVDGPSAADVRTALLSLYDTWLAPQFGTAPAPDPAP